MRKTLLIAGVVVLAAIMIGLVASMGMGIISLPGVFLATLGGSSQAERPTITWFSPTPTAPPTFTPSPTPYPTAAFTRTPTAVRPTQTPVATVRVIFYAVQPGDTLERIAARFGVAPADILKANNLPPDSTIFPGQVLAIPSPKTTPTPVPTPTPTLTSTVVTGP